MSGPTATVQGATAYLGRYVGLTRVRCNGTAGLSRGAPVFLSGESDGRGVAYGALSGFFPATHILLQDLDPEAYGWAARAVEWTDFDTSGLSPGALYVSAGSGGEWTQTAPSGVAFYDACGLILGEGHVILFAPGVRFNLPATISGTVTFYVRPTGNDANNGNSVGQAWATLSHALSATANRVVQDSATLRINVSGLFLLSATQELTKCAKTVGSGRVEVYGDPAAPANARFSGLANAGNTFVITAVANVSGNVWRYSLGGGPDLSAVADGQSQFTAWGCAQSGNNGQFTVQAHDDGAKTIDVTNASGAAEAGSSGTGAATTSLSTVLKVSGIRGTNLVFNGVCAEGGRGFGSALGAGGAWWFDRSDAKIQNSLARYSGLGIQACDGSRLDIEGTTVEKNSDAIRADRLSFLYCSTCGGSNYGRVIASMNSYVRRDNVSAGDGNAEWDGGQVQ
ncbi:MAG TPA: hypothetical protein PL033_12285 [Candidatus Brocadiia bacterium]|nr:hypothetical protein [Candidatus Brocadiia bacterium]